MIELVGMEIKYILTFYNKTNFFLLIRRYKIKVL